MTRSSTPSKRPHRTTAPGPCASSAHPRLRQRPAARAHQQARPASPGGAAASMRAGQHVGLHHHAGAAARPACRRRCGACRSRARGCRSRRAPRSPRRAPCRRGSMPSGPGNISGKMVSTLARHMVSSILVGAVGERVRWRHRPRSGPPARSTAGTDRVGERQHHGRRRRPPAAISIRSPAPKLCTAMHRAERRAAPRHRRKADRGRRDRIRPRPVGGSRSRAHDRVDVASAARPRCDRRRP